MNDNEIEKLKSELMDSDWTENLHLKLKELDEEDAKKIIESMSKSEIYQKVNNREFQEDYIADYVRYLWDISETSFWKHIIILLDVDNGVLWSDNMFHFKKLCNENIPKNVLDSILNFAICCDEKNKSDLEVIGCVIKAQVEQFNRLTEIRTYISLLNNELQFFANKRINEMINCECNYDFG